MNPADPAPRIADASYAWNADPTHQNLQARSDARRQELLSAAHALREPFAAIGRFEQTLRKALPMVPQAMLALVFVSTLSRLTRVRRLGPLALIAISLDVWRLWKVVQQFRALSATAALQNSAPQHTSLENMK